MTTKRFYVFSEQDESEILKAGEILRNGGIVAIPTETVYGLAANAHDESAIRRVFEAKGRPQDNPLIVHISCLEEIEGIVEDFPDSAKMLAGKFWPGPFTMILKRSDRIPASVSAGLDTVAVRMPADPIARAIIKAAGVPLAAPSANLSGSPSPTSAARTLEDMDGRVDGVVVSHDCEIGVESTVISLVGEKPRLLRPGAVTLEQLKEILPDIEVDKAVLRQPDLGAPVASPGMKYKHYAPKTDIYLVEGNSDQFISYLNSMKTSEPFAALCFEEEANQLDCKTVVLGSEFSKESEAKTLFEALRKIDEIGVLKAFAHAPEKSGVGLAVYNRLIRAAGFKVIQL